MFDLLAKNWWVLVLRGIIAILFGLFAYAWPGITLATLILFFGAYVLVDGILLLGHAIGGWRQSEDRWLLLLEGLLGVGIGIITFAAPGVTAVGLFIYIVAWSLATGVLEIAAAIRLRKEIENEWWLILSGIASIIFAVLVMFFPSAGALGLLWLIATYAIVFGVIMIIAGFKLRGLRSRSKGATARP
jgi:uncharacterized membrane protein HdeD (DUF308 family)